jgi:VIT1/CCC1 family predicted Fe2+/Mn2+ transporter
MTEQEKKHGFMDTIKDVLSFIPQIISATILPPIVEGAEIVMKNVDDRIKQIEKRILRKILSFAIIGFGGLLLIFALFFFLVEYLMWNNSTAFFSIGITVFVVGLILKLSESDK